jgi:hypothetical protein
MTTFEDRRQYVSSDKERLIRIETILTNVIESQSRIEVTIMSHISKLEQRLKLVEDSVDAACREDGQTYRKLKYRIIEFILLAMLGAVIGYFAPRI